MYTKKFADGGPAQQVTQFQPTFSPAQQGLGSIQQAPDTPAMEMSPQDYSQSPQYAPTQQYGAPTQQYDAPAANPMTAGLGSYMEGLKYQAPPPPPAAPAAAPAARNYSWNSGKYADEAALRGALGTYATQNNYTPASVDTWMGDQATYGISSTPAAAPSTTTAYNPQTQQYTAPTAPVEPAAPAAPAVNYGYIPGVMGYPDEANYGSPGAAGGHVNGSTIGYAQGGSIPQGIASLGRGQDSMLVHMTPGEVQGLQRLAMAHGGSLTINPQTGLPEAGFLSAILPMVGAGIGMALVPATGGMSLAMAGALGGAAGGMLGNQKNPLMGGLMGGISGYGMGGLGEAFAGMGAETLTGAGALPFIDGAGAEALANAGSNSVANANSLATASGNPLIQQGIPGMPQAPSPGDFLESQVASLPAMPPAIATNAGYGQGISEFGDAPFASQAPATPTETLRVTTPVEAAQGKFGSTPVERGLTTTDTGMMGGFRQATSSPGAAGEFLKKNWKSAAMAGAPLLMGLSALGGKTALPGKTPAQYYGTSYSPGTVNPRFGQPGQPYFLGQGYGQGAYSTAYAEGGDVARPYRGGDGEARRYSRQIYSDDPDAGINTNTDSGLKSMFAKAGRATVEQYAKGAKNSAHQAAALEELYSRNNAVSSVSAAEGGLMGLNTYAAGGKLLQGPGDGMSDSIPAVIQGKRPQRAALAQGEFVIPADVVSHLGNGSTDAGSKRLYAMMDKVRKARTGNPKQGKRINPERFLPA